jgi:hypothetical protein
MSSFSSSSKEDGGRRHLSFPDALEQGNRRSE